MQGHVAAVSTSGVHGFSKQPALALQLLEGLGVAGDAHAGVTVKHRSRVAKDPSQPNLRQVHLIHLELIVALAAAGFRVAPGTLGENITTSGLDLLALPTGALLRIGDAVLEVTGLRNPCLQLDRFQPGLMAAVLGRDAAGNLVRKAGIMAVVRAGGTVTAGDGVVADMPPLPHRPLLPV